MELTIQAGKEAEWTAPLISNPWDYFDGPIQDELEAFHPRGALLQRLRLRIERLSSNNSVVVSTLNDILREPGDFGKKIRGLGALMQSSEFIASLKHEEPEPLPDYGVSMAIVPGDDFYVRPFVGRRLGKTMYLKVNKKPDLVKKIQQALPPGYGIRVENDERNDKAYNAGALPYREIAQVNVVGESKADVLKAVGALGYNKPYETLLVVSKDKVLMRQAAFLIALNNDSTEREPATAYALLLRTDKDTAMTELEEMAGMGVLKLREPIKGAGIEKAVAARYSGEIKS